MWSVLFSFLVFARIAPEKLHFSRVRCAGVIMDADGRSGEMAGERTLDRGDWCESITGRRALNHYPMAVTQYLITTLRPCAHILYYTVYII